MLREFVRHYFFNSLSLERLANQRTALLREKKNREPLLTAKLLPIVSLTEKNKKRNVDASEVNQQFANSSEREHGWQEFHPATFNGSSAG